MIIILLRSKPAQTSVRTNSCQTWNLLSGSRHGGGSGRGGQIKGSSPMHFMESATQFGGSSSWLAILYKYQACCTGFCLACLGCPVEAAEHGHTPMKKKCELPWDGGEAGGQPCCPVSEKEAAHWGWVQSSKASRRRVRGFTFLSRPLFWGQVAPRCLTSSQAVGKRTSVTGKQAES